MRTTACWAKPTLAVIAITLLLATPGAIFGQNVIIDEGLAGGVADPASNLVILNATMITEPVPGSGDFVL